jgi:hypothetical protein
MKRGIRTISRECACGCGEGVQPYISKRTGRVEYYPKFIPGHGSRDWGKRWSGKLAANPMVHPKSKPIGTTRLHESAPGLIYWQIKVTPRGRWKYEHRDLIERFLCRRLSEGEHVHHINEDTLDNRLENLQVLSASEHHSHHSTLSGWSKLYASCSSCGTTDRKHVSKGLCTACYQRLPRVKAVRRRYLDARKAGA